MKPNQPGESDRITHCPTCGERLWIQDRFCPECGTKVAGPAINAPHDSPPASDEDPADGDTSEKSRWPGWRRKP